MNEELNNMNMDSEKAKEILKLREQSSQQIDVFDEALKEMQNSTNTIQQPTVAKIQHIPSPLGKVDMGFNRPENEIQTGFITIPLQNLPTSGLFYPEDTAIQIRSASVKEIRHYSTLDEQYPYDIEEKHRTIIKNCCRIRIPDKHGADYRDIADIDRMYILFAIQELTFPNGENKLQITAKCTECSTSNTIDFKKNSIDYLNLDDRLKGIYNQDEKCFILNFKSSDDSIRLYMPTVGKTNILQSFVQNKLKNNVEIDFAFINISNFLFSDWRIVNEKSIREMDQKSFKWSPTVLSAVVGIIDLIRNGVSVDVKYVCNNCGSEVTTPLEFQGGWKSLFLYSDPFANLL